MRDKIIKELENLYKLNYLSPEDAKDFLVKLKQYYDTCPEDLKEKLDSGISYCDNIIERNKEYILLTEQIEIFRIAAKSFISNKDISLRMEHDDIYYKFFIKLGAYDMLMLFKLRSKEIRTWFYFNTRPFMLKKNINDFAFMEKSKGGHYIKYVSDFNWGNAFQDILNQMSSNYDALLKACSDSCAYYPDGTPKYKQWKNYAKLKVVRISNNHLEQGFKNGETPYGSHIVGGNGSFVLFEKGRYALEYAVERISLELPIRRSHWIDIDTFIREIKDRNGWHNLRYDLINSKLPIKVPVVTYEMEKDPRDRKFLPLECGGSWLELLKKSLKNL